MTVTGPYTLTPARAEYADALHRMLCVPQVYRFLADGAPPPRTVTEAWLTQSAEDFERHQVGLWLLRAGDRLAGCMLLEMMHTLPGDAEPAGKTAAELTYVLHPDHWGKGLATRMAWTVMAHAFEAGIDAILAGADAPNIASIAVMKRLGMTFHRTVQYPAGEGVEYLLRATDPPPENMPAMLPFTAPT